MESGEKKFLIILVIVAIIIVCILVGLRNNKNKQKQRENDNLIQNGISVSNELNQYVQNMEDGSKLNVSDALNKPKQLDGLEITNIQFKEIGTITTLLADVTNKTEIATKEKEIKVEVLDKQGNVITTLQGSIDSILPGEKVQLNMAVTVDVANAYDIRISNK